MSKRMNFLFGFFSLFGLIGLNYFSTHDPSYLSYFAFFAFLANFFVARVDTSVLDERYYENVRAAKAFTFDVAIIEVTIFFIINLIMSLYFPAAILGYISVGLVAICYASLIATYGIKLYNLEKR